MFVHDHYHLSCGKKIFFEEGKLQLSGSKVQEEHHPTMKMKVKNSQM